MQRLPHFRRRSISNSVVYILPYKVAPVFARLEETQNALDWLQRTFEERDVHMPFLLDHKWKPDPRESKLPNPFIQGWIARLREQSWNAMTVEIKPATLEELPVLSNLFQLYIHDFTDFIERPLGSDGRFDYNPLPPYWTEPDHFPFIVLSDGKLSGFALVKKARSSPGTQKSGTWPTSS